MARGGRYCVKESTSPLLPSGYDLYQIITANNISYTHDKLKLGGGSATWGMYNKVSIGLLAFNDIIDIKFLFLKHYLV